MVDQQTPVIATIEHFNLHSQLGEGQFGTGFKATDTNSNATVCVKVFKNTSEQSEKSFKVELNTGYKGFNHPNILKMLGAGRNQLKVGEAEKGERLFIVSELAPNGELFEYVQDAGGFGGPKEPICRQLFSQLIDAIEYIHAKGVAHRDLKLENVFLGKNVDMKVADFGLMKIFSGEGGDVLKTKCGTPNYMGPELVNLSSGQNYDGEHSDIFAAGVMLFMMLSGKQPFNEAGDVWYSRILRKPVAAVKQRNIDIGKDAIELIAGMIAKEPKDRLTPAQIKSHAWLKGQTATKQQVYEHFSGMAQQKKAEQLQSQQEKRKSNSTKSGPHRSTGDGVEVKLNEDEETIIEEAVERLEDGNLFDWQHCEQQKNQFGCFIMSNEDMVTPLLTDLSVYLKSLNYSCTHSDETRTALAFRISDQHFGEKWEADEEFPEELAPAATFVNVEIEVKKFKEDQEADEEESRTQVSINRLSGSAFTFAAFVNQVTGKEGILYNYDDSAL